MPPAPKPLLRRVWYSLGPAAENVLPDVLLRDVIIALDEYLACASQPGHFLVSRQLLLVDMEPALGGISRVRRA
jgi:hypothetical protein